MEFKDRIKKLRMQKEMTQTQLAAVLNKGDSAIRMWETGRSKPDMDTVIKLTKMFNCTADYLLGIADNMLSEHVNISEVTGLTDESIEVLKFIKNLDSNDKGIYKFDIDFINFILEQEKLPPKIDDNIVNSMANNKKIDEYYDELEKELQIWWDSHKPILTMLYNYFKTNSTDIKIIKETDGTVYFCDTKDVDNDISVNNINKKHENYINTHGIPQKDVIDYVFMNNIQNRLKKAKELYLKKQGESYGERT